MHTLNAASILEKNKIASTGAWLILLDIIVPEALVPEGISLYLVLNTEDIKWNGQQYVAFPFDMSEYTEDGREIPAVTLKVSNVTQAMQQWLELAGGGVGSQVTVRIVHSDCVEILREPPEENVPPVYTNMPPDLEEVFVCESCRVDAHWVSFTLGPGDPASVRRPERRFLKNFCPYPYKGLECGATSPTTSCNKTLADCRARGNSTRFGGEPSIPQGGIYVNL